MGEIKIGDLVARKSYNRDILFKVVEIINQSGRERVYILKGVNMRIMVDAPETDLTVQTAKELRKFEKSNHEMVSRHIDSGTNLRKARSGIRGIKGTFFEKSRNPFGRPGRVLHLDGDKDYLDMCMKAYKEMEVNATGKYMPESQQPKGVTDMLKEYLPDILVLTGHDSVEKNKDINDISHYRNSRFYVAAVKEARKFEPSYDDLVIYAGACQSYFEAILDAGANFASSPNRVLIHALDPVFVCHMVAYSNIERIIPVEELVSKTITGIEGIGGLQTRGKYREGLPGPVNTRGQRR